MSLRSIKISSSQIIYSEHDVDECFEYKNGEGRVPDGIAIGYTVNFGPSNGLIKDLFLFDDIKYSEYDHEYWNNLELEEDIDRIFLP
jgi:DNA-directed RNA polymerase subunit E'/Rpb7